MALNHVAQRARGFIKRRPLLHAEALRGGDLNVIDVVAIPKRLEDAVPESQHQKILNRVFPQKMIDAIDLRLVESFENVRLSSLAEARSRPKGFSMTMRDPGFILRRLRQASLLDLGDHLGINGRRRSKVVQAIAFQMALAVEFFQAVRKFLKRVGLVVISGDVGEGLRETPKALIAYSGSSRIRSVRPPPRNPEKRRRSCGLRAKPIMANRLASDPQ